MPASFEVSVSPFLCCNYVGRGDLVSTQVLFSKAVVGFGRIVELLRLRNSFWLAFSYPELKEESLTSHQLSSLRIETNMFFKIRLQQRDPNLESRFVGSFV